MIKISDFLFCRIVPSICAAAVAAGLVSCAAMTRDEQLKMLRLNEEAEPADISVSRLIQEMQKVSDPKGKFRSAKAYIMRQKTVSETEMEKRRIAQEYMQEVIFEQPDKIRWTFFRNGTPFKLSICKGGHAWSIDSQTKKAVEITGFGLNLFNMSTAMLNPGKTYLDIFSAVEVNCVYEGKRRFYRLVCQSFDERIAPYVVYVDAETFLPAKAETIMYADGGEQYLYSAQSTDYQWVDDILLPRVTIVSAGTRKDICTTYDFKLNPKLDADEFDLPQWFQVKLRPDTPDGK